MADKMPATNVCYLYLMGTGERYKIGISANPPSRLRTLRGHVGPELSLLKVYKFQSIVEAREAESRCHGELRKYHLFGEWFALQAPVDKVLKSYKRSREFDDILKGEDPLPEPAIINQPKRIELSPLGSSLKNLAIIYLTYHTVPGYS